MDKIEKNLAKLEARATEAENQTKALRARCEALERSLAQASADRTSATAAPAAPAAAVVDKAPAVKGKKGKKGKKAQVEFGAGIPVFKGEAKDITFRVQHEVENGFACTVCQKGAKVFFDCATPYCPHRTCADCNRSCGKCQEVVCAFCSACAKCEKGHSYSLVAALRGIVSFLSANSTAHKDLEGWPGIFWIQSVQTRLEEWESRGVKSNGPDDFLNVLLSFDWSTGESRALGFLIPILRRHAKAKDMTNFYA